MAETPSLMGVLRHSFGDPGAETTSHSEVLVESWMIANSLPAIDKFSKPMCSKSDSEAVLSGLNEYQLVANITMTNGGLLCRHFAL